MPTARELLEQADALMRRNRSAVGDDIPVLTEAVSPPPVLRVPLRPSPESAPMPLPDESDGTEDAPDVIPTLTQKVPPSEPPAAGAVLAEGEPSDWLDYDEGEPSITGKAPDSVLSVPEIVSAAALREAADGEAEDAQVTEEIELAPAAEAAFEAEFEDAPEIVAPAPEVAPAPPATPRDDAPASARTPWLDTELPPEVDALPVLAAEAGMVFESPSSVSWNVEAALADSATDAGAPAGEADGASGEDIAASAVFAASPATEADVPLLAGPESVMAQEPVEPPAAPSDDVSLVPSPAAAFATPEAPPATVTVEPATDDVAVAPVTAEPEVEPGAAAPAWVSPLATLPAAIESPAVAPLPVVAVPVVAPAPPSDHARWEAMAEEIRMQVLQRIDLFTDTGLREQLGRRLQPIVDRASADLVRTINQHVGELLRAYVAEAIEREIDRWKSSLK